MTFRQKRRNGEAFRKGREFATPGGVVLVDLHERFYILCRHQARVMALLAQSLAEAMRARTGFDPNQVRLHVRGESSKFCSSKPSTACKQPKNQINPPYSIGLLSSFVLCAF
jgi:hypothetical protein